MQTAVLVLTFGLAAVVVALYVWFVVIRYRAEKRKKATEAASRDAPLLRSSAPADAAAAGPAVAAPDMAAPAEPEEITIAGLLTGIRLPCDLLPLTNIEPRVGVGDRVAFVTTGVPAATVGTAFTAELERLGYTIVPIGHDELIAEKPSGSSFRAAIHAFPAGVVAGNHPAFPTAPEGSVVVETWVPLP